MASEYQPAAVKVSFRQSAPVQRFSKVGISGGTSSENICAGRKFHESVGDRLLKSVAMMKSMYRVIFVNLS